MITIWLFVIPLFWTNSVLCRICDIEDSKCTTIAGALAFKLLVKGGKGWAPSEPLYRDLIEVNQPEIDFKLIDTTLNGFKNCVIKLLAFNDTSKTYKNAMMCSRMVVRGNYEMKGTLNSIDVEGKGGLRVILNGFLIKFDVDYEMRYLSARKRHMRILSHTVDVEVTQGVRFMFDNLYEGDKARSRAFIKEINKNWKGVHTILGPPVMESFMEVYMKNLNDLLATKPITDLLKV